MPTKLVKERQTWVSYCIIIKICPTFLAIYFPIYILQLICQTNLAQGVYVDALWNNHVIYVIYFTINQIYKILYNTNHMDRNQKTVCDKRGHLGNLR